MTHLRPTKKHSKRRQIYSTCLAGCLAIGVSFTSSPVLLGQNPETEYALAAGFYARQQWDLSAEAFELFIADHPGTPQALAAHFFLGEAHVQQNNFAAAYPAYQRYLNLYPEGEFSSRATFRLGECAYRTGNTKAALKTLEAFVADFPNHDLIEYALPYLGELRLKRSEPQLAQAAFEAALKHYPGSNLSNQSRLGLAKSLQSQGSIEDALRLFTFVAAAPDSEFTGQANLQLGVIKFKQNDFDAARNYLRRSMSQNTGALKAEAGYWLSRTEMATDNQAAAVKLIDAMSAFDLPEDLGCMMLFDGAVAATKIEDNATAMRWLAVLRSKYPQHHLADEAALLELNLIQKTGDNRRVVELADAFASNFSDSPHALPIAEMAGRSYYATGDFENTVGTYRRLLEDHPTNFNADGSSLEAAQISADTRKQRATWLYLKSLGHLGLKQYRDAVEELNLADAYNEDAKLSALIDLGLATAYFNDQQFSLAVPRYRSFLANHDATDGSVSPAELTRSACELTICFNELKQWDEVRSGFEIMKSSSDLKRVNETTQYLAEQAFEADQEQLATELYAYMTADHQDQTIQSQGLAGLAWVYMESPSDEATPFFGRLIDQYPDSSFSSKATMAHAKYLESQNDPDGAIEVYSMVANRFDQMPIANVARLRQANLMHRSGGQHNLEQAHHVLKDYLQSSTEKTAADEALYLLGWVMHDQGNAEQALVRFERLIAQFPDSKYWSDAAFRVSQHQLKNGQQDSALALMDQILEHQQSPPEVLSRVRYLKSQIAVADKDWADVADLMKAVIEDDVDEKLTWRAKYWLAESQYQQKLYNQASQGFAAIISANQIERSLGPWVQLRMAQCLGKLQRWDDAGMVANDALHQYGDFENDYQYVFVKARSAEAKGLFEDAEELYTQVIQSANGRQSETAAIAQWRIGEMHFHKEDFKTAIQAYYRVDSLYTFPQWRSAAVLQAGKCQEHLGNWKHAAKLYAQILEKYPDSELAKNASQRLQLVNRLAEKPMQPQRR